MPEDKTFWKTRLIFIVSQPIKFVNVAIVVVVCVVVVVFDVVTVDSLVAVAFVVIVVGSSNLTFKYGVKVSYVIEGIL